MSFGCTSGVSASFTLGLCGVQPFSSMYGLDSLHQHSRPSYSYARTLPRTTYSSSSESNSPTVTRRRRQSSSDFTARKVTSTYAQKKPTTTLFTSYSSRPRKRSVEKVEVAAPNTTATVKTQSKWDKFKSCCCCCFGCPKA